MNVGYHTRIIENHLKYAVRQNYLVDKVNNCKELGVTNELYCDHEVVVSLTTHGKRLYDVALTIESIMQGTIKPNRIILWLSDGAPINSMLLRQKERGLEVCTCEDMRSFTKLVPALKMFPGANIITIDDDALYNYDLVENLIIMHKQYPQHIIANRIHRIKLNKDNRPLSYLEWQWNNAPEDDSPLNFFTGVGGVLYPPYALDSEVMNKSVFLDICKYADDIWFNAMALKAGTRVRKGFTHSIRGEDYLSNEDIQDSGLYRININTRKNTKSTANDIQLEAVFNKYDLWDKLLL